VSAFRWVPQDAEGNDLEPTAGFPTQEEAEGWMGREWSRLLAEGAESVVLRGPGDRFVYRMGLREA
jgi:hypothetical protein